MASFGKMSLFVWSKNTFTLWFSVENCPNFKEILNYEKVADFIILIKQFVDQVCFSAVEASLLMCHINELKITERMGTYSDMKDVTHEIWEV